jgi:hypothetical protein
VIEYEDDDEDVKTLAKEPLDRIPQEFLPWKKVFSKEESKRMPTRKPWDHKIELQENFEPRRAKIYPLSPDEQ